jgi:hypothetical protein
MTRRCLPIFLISAALLLASCSAWVEPGQPKSVTGQDVPLTAGQTLGQTFVAREAGLSGVQIFFTPQTGGEGEIHFHLRADPQSTEDLATSRLPVTSVVAPGFYRFNFSPQADSRRHYYYIFLELTGSGTLLVGSAEGDSYLDGALYQAGAAQNSQMAFHLAYAPGFALIGLLGEMINWGRMLAIGFFLFILPGWALISLAWPASNPLAWPEKVGVAAGLSLAVYALLFLWTASIGLHLGSGYAWLPPLVGLIILAWQSRQLRLAQVKERWQAWVYSDAFKPELAWLWVGGLIFLTRFFVIRSLPAPLGGDAYQHTLVTQLLVDNGGLFNSWQPYADLQSFTYHFGFHTASAVFHWVSGLSVMEAVLWTGQLLNGLAILVLYPLTLRAAQAWSSGTPLRSASGADARGPWFNGDPGRAGGNRWVGIGAMVIAGLLSPMPMAYVNWGRYTQLAGQVILPIAIYLFWTTVSAEVKNWRLLALTAIAWSGLALTHYRVFIFAVVFGLAYLIVEARQENWRERLERTFWAGLATGILFLPWFIHLFGGKILGSFFRLASTPVEAVSVVAQENNTLNGLLVYVPPLVAVALGLSCLWGLWQRKRGWTLVSLWWLLLLLATNPQWLHLPGQGIVTNFAYLVAAYIPLGILGSLGVNQLIDKWGSGHRTLIFGVAALSFGLLGSYLRLGDFQPRERGLVTYPDLQAAAWIKENTPLEARFLVNSRFAYGGSLIAGGDAGRWLPLLAGRRTSAPPLVSGFEQSVNAEGLLQIKELMRAIQDKGIAEPQVLALIHEQGFDYVYIGQRNGREAPLLDPEQLRASPAFQLLYHHDRVWIFGITPVTTQSFRETR